MLIPFFRFPKWSCATLALGAFLASGSLSYAQPHPLRGGATGVGGNLPLATFPAQPMIPLLNNGSLQVSPNPARGFPNIQPYAYIASLPLGDRLPYNGIFADPQMLPQTIFGQQFNQNLLQLQQQILFGNPLGPVGTLLALGLINQPGAPGQPAVPPNFVGWGARRPNGSFPSLAAGLAAGLAYNNPYMGQGLGYNPYMGQGLGYNPYMGQGMGFDPTMFAQGMAFSPYMVNPYMFGMGMANPGFNLDPNQNNNGANLLAQP